MKRTFVVLTILLLALTATFGVANATPVDELTALAEYAPEGAPVFVTVRTDAGYFETLDGLVGSLADELGLNDPDLLIEAPGVTDVIDQLLNDLLPLPYDGTFEEDIRPWLGDNIAFMVTSTEMAVGDPSLGAVAAIAVSDEDALRAWLEDYYAQASAGTVEVIEDDSMLLYESQSDFQASTLLVDGVLFVGLASAFEGVVMPGDDVVTLAQTSEFQDAVSALPEDDYNILAYINAEAVLTELAPMFDEMMSEDDTDAMMGMFGMGVSSLSELADGVGQQVLAFTLLNGRSFVLDYAVSGNDFSTTRTPVNTDLMTNLPADTPLVIVDTGIGDTINEVFAALEMMDMLFEEQGMSFGEMSGVPALDIINPNSLAVFLRNAFEGTTGLNLDDTLAWMNGTFALYLALESTELDGLTVPVPAPGIIVETDNAEATAEYVEVMAQIATDIFVNATFEDGTLTIPANEVGLVVPEDFQDAFAIADIQLASNDLLAMFGFASNVQFALSPEGDSLADTDSYAYESSLFLDDATAIWLIDLSPVAEPLINFLEASGMATPNDIEMLESLLGIAATSSITTASDSARFTITLSE